MLLGWARSGGPTAVRAFRGNETCPHRRASQDHSRADTRGTSVGDRRADPKAATPAQECDYCANSIESSTRMDALETLSPCDAETDALRVIIDTPKTSRNRLSRDEKKKFFKFAASVRRGMK